MGKTYKTIKPVLKVKAKSGASRLGFAARLSKKVVLKRGTYRVTLQAADAAGNRSKAVKATFKVK